jgi:hypothetical protein
MLPKFFASWLVLLIVVPFTAPFSTCDLASLFGTSQNTPVAPSASVVLTTDVAVPSGLAVSSAGRVRLGALSRISLTKSAIPSSAATLMSFVVWSGHPAEHIVLSTILRL